MRILIITQIVDKNDPVLGFFHTWLRAFAGEVEQIEAIGLQVGQYDLPKNVQVYSLGKEQRTRSSFRYTWRLWKLAWQLRHEYDVVFAHMNPEYVLAGAPMWKLLGKPITLWYAHGTTSWRLRMATLLSRRVFTSTTGGFRLKTGKARIIGQGIDTEQFSPQSVKTQKQATHQLVTVGRITPSKHIDTLIRAMAYLEQTSSAYHLTIIGTPKTLAEFDHLERLGDVIRTLRVGEQVTFTGPIANDRLPSRLSSHDIFISDGSTGSLDKALLEAMAMKLMVISSNEAFAGITPRPKETTFPLHDHVALAEQIVRYTTLRPEDRESIKEALYETVRNDHSLERFALTIAAELNTLL